MLDWLTADAFASVVVKELPPAVFVTPVVEVEPAGLMGESDGTEKLSTFGN